MLLAQIAHPWACRPSCESSTLPFDAPSHNSPQPGIVSEAQVAQGPCPSDNRLTRCGPIAQLGNMSEIKCITTWSHLCLLSSLSSNQAPDRSPATLDAFYLFPHIPYRGGLGIWS
ncbi:E3 ubiquitin-protein ligase [Fusarium oxysporum f. sp. albedinis]|nr:E3 ubiquitin-protein ligase [Fusarium oxysporum f. sp. albedinis]